MLRRTRVGTVGFDARTHRHLRTDLLTHVGGHLADDAAVVALQRTRSQLPAGPDRQVHERRLIEETGTTVRRGITAL